MPKKCVAELFVGVPQRSVIKVRTGEQTGPRYMLFILTTTEIGSTTLQGDFYNDTEKIQTDVRKILGLKGLELKCGKVGKTVCSSANSKKLSVQKINEMCDEVLGSLQKLGCRTKPGLYFLNTSE